ncbi:terpene synthase 10-like isoform X2 [Papaver somniferum]|uniref:terpene synthase 10-like isoform X2 n=1 Tax=Papaver somniferum TaxID=3469 RepID=UPI000E6FC033|nr:terpene synthase 10-like isoform X2 [Papaver somniferum]
MGSHYLVQTSNFFFKISKESRMTLRQKILAPNRNENLKFHIPLVASRQISTTIPADKISDIPYTPSPQSEVNKQNIRRSANYQPNTWDLDFVQSLNSSYRGEFYRRQAEKLKGDIRSKLSDAARDQSSSLLKLIDTIQRLGYDYHFENEIKNALDTVFSIEEADFCEEKDWYTRALRFRLLRQHGYEVSQDVFKDFKEEIKQSSITNDVEGMLSLYEASFYAFEREDISVEVQEYTRINLADIVQRRVNKNDPGFIFKQVSHALEAPLNWRVPRLEAKWFIENYKRMSDMEPLLLEFAILDFNMVQATYQEDLKYVSRRQITKVISFVTTIDDIYDVYGSLEELKLFTKAVERWDINMVEELPDYMKICFLALFNTTNEMAYENMKLHGRNTIPYLHKAWVDLCKAYLVEATWFYSGYTPTFEEYMSNAWVSISGPTVQFIAYFLLTDEITEDALESIWKHTDLMRWSSTIFRLVDDLGTSQDELARGDVPKAIQCYMHQTGADERAACEHINRCMNDNWKRMNKERLTERCILPQAFIDSMSNMTRMAQYIYQHGDGYGVSRGDVPKAIQCYMHQTGADERAACEHINRCMNDNWKRMNKERLTERCILPQAFIDSMSNMTRMAQYIYQHGDGYGVSDFGTKEKIMSIVVEPIQS